MDMPNENEYLLAISIFIYLTDLTVFGNMTNNNIHVIESCSIPLVKNRCGDLTDQDIYRLVALVNILSKVSELALLSRFKKFL